VFCLGFVIGYNWAVPNPAKNSRLDPDRLPWLVILSTIGLHGTSLSRGTLFRDLIESMIKMRNSNFTNREKAYRLFSRRQRLRWLPCLLAILPMFLVVSLAGAQEPKDRAAVLERGAAIYRDICASCHGDSGQGVASAYANPLSGDSTVGELTQLIEATMPEGEPEKCVGPDAAAVAAYIHEQFYGPAAQVRNRPPRAMLARLTANQLRQSLADVYAHFAGMAESTDDRGVYGMYFDGTNQKEEHKKIKRVDPVLQFDFGHAGPGESITPDSFSIVWEGSLLADHTGRYEIVVRSSCSFKMDFGRGERVFIDNHVQSGDKTEFRKSIMLTAGRVYPFRIDFVQRKRKTEIPPANISLSWVPPHGIEEIIPTRALIPRMGNGVFPLQSTLPPDDRSYGFERGISVSREWDESTTAASIEFAKIASSELYSRYLRKHKDEPNENRAQLKAFLKELIEVAFRGNVADELLRVYIDSQLEREPDDAEAIKRVLLMALKSPRFLYPLADADRSQSQRVANRLALTFFDSLPSDRWLLDKVNQNALADAGTVRRVAEKMVQDLRTRAKVRSLMHEWLNIASAKEISKSPTAFAGFDAAVAYDLRNSLDAFLDHVIWSETSDYRQLFTADWAFTSERIANYYGQGWAKEESAPSGASKGDLFKTAKDGGLHHGLLTHPYMMSQLAYFDSTSPIHRGVFLIRYMLGRTLRPPNDAFTPLSPDLHPDLTTRERVALQTSPANCQTCHIKINALGFVLENYDAVGRFRESERNKPIESSGGYLSRSDTYVPFQGVGDLANYLAGSDDSHRAFVNRAFQYMVKQPAGAFGPAVLDELTAKFVQSGYNMRQLLVEIAVVAATIPETPHPPKEG
jgi:mono/diheme cytochrome c family protein